MAANQPLAERLRPRKLDDYIGQEHLVGKNAVLRKMIESGNLSSLILWGPPGVGKTTLAKIIANTLERPFYTLSAVNSGVKDVREVIEKAKKQQFFNKPNPQIAAGFPARRCGRRNHHAHWRHHRKPIIRGHLPAPLPLPGLYSGAAQQRRLTKAG